LSAGLSPNTIAAYKQDLLEFLAFVKKEEQMPAWPQEAVDIDAFLAKERDYRQG
jgi:integrase/recombinase XerD